MGSNAVPPRKGRTDPGASGSQYACRGPFLWHGHLVRRRDPADFRHCSWRWLQSSPS